MLLSKYFSTLIKYCFSTSNLTLIFNLSVYKERNRESGQFLIAETKRAMIKIVLGLIFDKVIEKFVDVGNI